MKLLYLSLLLLLINNIEGKYQNIEYDNPIEEINKDVYESKTCRNLCYDWIDKWYELESSSDEDEYRYLYEYYYRDVQFAYKSDYIQIDKIMKSFYLFVQENVLINEVASRHKYKEMRKIYESPKEPHRHPIWEDDAYRTNPYPYYYPLETI